MVRALTHSGAHNQTMVITDRHAHGLARHDLHELRERCRRASEGAFRKFNASDAITTGKGARRVIAKVDHSFEGTAWACRAHTDRHGTYAAWLVPLVGEDEIAVCCVSLRMPVGAGVRLRQWPWLIVPKHAIARGHQRLRDADWLAVQSELREAAMQAAAVLLVSMQLGLRQFAIPAVRGLLIGEVGEVCLQGKTFIVPPFSRRWGSVLDAWVRFEQHLPKEVSTAIEDLALDHETPEHEAAVAALAKELADLDFLREPHEPGEDIVGDLWEAARAQQDRQE